MINVAVPGGWGTRSRIWQQHCGAARGTPAHAVRSTSGAAGARGESIPGCEARDGLQCRSE